MVLKQLLRVGVVFNECILQHDCRVSGRAHAGRDQVEVTLYVIERSRPSFERVGVGVQRYAGGCGRRCGGMLKRGRGRRPPSDLDSEALTNDQGFVVRGRRPSVAIEQGPEELIFAASRRVDLFSGECSKACHPWFPAALHRERGAGV
jgi:hypothetical protein